MTDVDCCTCQNRKHDRHGRCLSCGKVDKQTAIDMEKVMEELRNQLNEERKNKL